MIKSYYPRFILFLILIGLDVFPISINNVFAKEYYISSAGSDTSDGSSISSSWQTISKVNSSTFLSGDEIYFNRGDIFCGQIEINRSGITIGAYGSSDNKPVISGAIQLANWTVYNGSIYTAQAPLPVKNIYADDVQMTLARYPNSGFLFIEATDGSMTISNTELNQGSGYWNDANVRIRTRAYAYENVTVFSHDGITITFSHAPDFAIEAGWGFYLDNKLSELDAPGEWYYDSIDNKVYLFAPGGVDPNTLNIKGAVYDYGINCNSQNDVTIENLDFRYQAVAGIKFDNTTTNNRVISNNLYGALIYGILITGQTSHLTIDGNTIESVNGCGIFANYPSSVIIKNNTIKNVGLVPGYGRSGTNGMTGIRIGGSDNIVQGNIIDSVGYSGIALYGSNNVAENNIMTNSMLKLIEGGTLYTYDGNANIMRNNIIHNVVGDMESMPYRKGKNSKAIHVDGTSHDIIIEGNTISRVSSGGIFVQYISYHNTIRNNTFIDCHNDTSYTAYIHILQNTENTCGQHTITKNVIYPTGPLQRFVLLQEENVTPDLHSPGILDSNYYLNPYNVTEPFGTVKRRSDGWTWGKYSFENWKTLASMGLDAHSKYIVPASHQRDTLFMNSTAFPVTVNLPPFIFQDLDGNNVIGSFTLSPYSSKVLIKDTTHAKAEITTDSSSLLFSDVIINTSIEKKIALWGLYLNPTSGNIIVSSQSAYFQVSTTSGSGFGNSLNIPCPGNTLDSIIIYVKFSPTAQQVYTDSISISGGGASEKNVVLTGICIFPVIPVLSVYPQDLSFGDITVNMVSDDKNYILSGISLSPECDSVIITAPLGFVVSIQKDTGYASTLKVQYADSVLLPVTIYVKFTPILAQNITGYILNFGGSAEIDSVYVHGRGILGLDTVDDDNILPKTIALKQNYPNPFNSSTVFSFDLPTASFTTLKIFDILGREVAMIVSQELPAGHYYKQWDAENIPSGIYLYRLQVKQLADGYTNTYYQTKKLTLLK